MKQIKLFPNKSIRILENALLINEELLVIGDLHIGYEEQVYSSGLLRKQMKDIFDRMDKLFSKLHKEKIKGTTISDCLSNLNWRYYSALRDIKRKQLDLDL